MHTKLQQEDVVYNISVELLVLERGIGKLSNRGRLMQVEAGCGTNAGRGGMWN